MVDRWEPLRAALAWRITDGDEDFVTWVGNHTEFNIPRVLVGGLGHKMYDAGCFVSLLQPYRQNWERQLALTDGYSGRFQRLAEGFEADRCADLNNGILCLDRYLLGRVNDAVREICQGIRDRKLSAEGLAIVDGIKRGIEQLPPAAITETMTLRELKEEGKHGVDVDGVLCAGLIAGGRCWKSVRVSWAGLIKCFPPAKLTVKAEIECARWLQRLMKETPNRRLRVKSDLFLEALVRTPVVTLAGSLVSSAALARTSDA